ncbi:hypothetical protein F7734_18435 [Scytonema sp. UIC 10036]|uniref:hypothetical protein n=1 Tax=Scytonema sp. UIC 10036 TaxID=2304196 RepID=UPI0012DAF6FA|nr:hypothetical protein [Scytonema sp. UIC 10036]MUG94252.1 hypothetical protein [Scytonema sp. UIC 10036]
MTSTDQITQLCEKFGYTLEYLTTENKQLLRAVLANYVIILSKYKALSLTKAMLETENMISQITSKCSRNTNSISVAIGILEGIEIDTAEGLIDILTKLIKDDSVKIPNSRNK